MAFSDPITEYGESLPPVKHKNERKQEKPVNFNIWKKITDPRDLYVNGEPSTRRFKIPATHRMEQAEESDIERAQQGYHLYVVPNKVKPSRTKSKPAPESNRPKRGTYAQEHRADQSRLNDAHKRFLRSEASDEELLYETYWYVHKRYLYMQTTKELRVFKGTPIAETVEDFASDLSIRLLAKVKGVRGKWANYVNTALEHDVENACRLKAEVIKSRALSASLIGYDEQYGLQIVKKMSTVEKEDEAGVADFLRSPLDRSPSFAPVIPTTEPTTAAELTEAQARRKAEDKLIRTHPDSLEVYRALRSGLMRQHEIAERFRLSVARVEYLVTLLNREIEHIKALAEISTASGE